jgi:hypothetical protein
MKTVKPVYVGSRGLEKPNYGPGYIGFSYNDSNLFSKGIVYFTKDEADNLSISHTFVVIDAKTIAEAAVGGVKLVPIAKYFDNPHYAVFFKKPKNLTPEISNRLVTEARSRSGRGYDYSLIVHFFLRKFFLYRWISESKLFSKQPSFFDSEDQEVCSEYVCEVLNVEPSYQSLYPLNEYHPSKIYPLRLFYADGENGVLEPWKFEEK